MITVYIWLDSSLLRVSHREAYFMHLRSHGASASSCWGVEEHR